MAFLYITEYERLARDKEGSVVLAGQEPAIAHQKIAIGGSSGQSAAFSALTKFVRVEVDAICHVVFLKDPTATTTHGRWAADQTEVRGVFPGDKLAVISGV